MLGKYYNPYSEYNSCESKPPGSSYNYWKHKRRAEKHKKTMQRQLFGQHYNYAVVGLNKQKKYMLQEQRNTEIERANRILFEKLQKIGQRGTPTAQRKRTHTHQHPQEPVQRQGQHFDRFEESSSYSPFQQKASKDQRLQEISKTNPLKTRVIFQGYRQIDEKLLHLTICLDNNSYLIRSQHGNLQHKIQIDLKDYRVLLRETLQGDHMNIFGLLRFNGAILELAGGKRQQVSIVGHQQLLLPAVPQLFQSKNRAYTS